MVSLAFVISFVASAVALVVGITIYSEVTDDLQKTLPVLDVESSATLGQGLATSDQPIAFGTTNQASIYQGLNPVDLVTAVTVPISGVILASGDEGEVTDQDRLPRGMAFSPDGTNLYFTGDSSDTIYHYSIPAWDISGIQLGINATSSIFIGADDSVPQGIAVKPDGSELYVVGDSTNRILAYGLPTPFILTNSTLIDTLDISALDTSPRGLFMDTLNERLWLVGNDNDSIYYLECAVICVDPIDDYNLVDTESVSAQETNPTGIFFKNDFTKLYIVGGTNIVYQYSLPINADVTSKVFDDVMLNVGADPKAIAFKSDGTEIFAMRITQ